MEAQPSVAASVRRLTPLLRRELVVKFLKIVSKCQIAQIPTCVCVCAFWWRAETADGSVRPSSPEKVWHQKTAMLLRWTEPDGRCSILGKSLLLITVCCCIKKEAYIHVDFFGFQFMWQRLKDSGRQWTVLWSVLQSAVFYNDNK